MLSAYASIGAGKAAARLIDLMEDWGRPPNARSYAQLVAAYTVSGDVLAAAKLLIRMQSPDWQGPQPNAYMYSMLLKELATRSTPEVAEAVMSALITPDEPTHAQQLPRAAPDAHLYEQLAAHSKTKSTMQVPQSENPPRVTAERAVGGQEVERRDAGSRDSHPASSASTDAVAEEAQAWQSAQQPPRSTTLLDGDDSAQQPVGSRAGAATSIAAADSARSSGEHEPMAPAGKQADSTSSNGAAPGKVAEATKDASRYSGLLAFGRWGRRRNATPERMQQVSPPLSPPIAPGTKPPVTLQRRPTPAVPLSQESIQKELSTVGLDLASFDEPDLTASGTTTAAVQPPATAPPAPGASAQAERPAASADEGSEASTGGRGGNGAAPAQAPDAGAESSRGHIERQGRRLHDSLWAPHIVADDSYATAKEVWNDALDVDKVFLDPWQAQQAIAELTLPDAEPHPTAMRGVGDPHPDGANTRLNAPVFGALAHGYMLSGHWREAAAVVGRARSAGVSPNMHLFNMAMWAAAQRGQHHVVHALLYEVPPSERRIPLCLLLFAQGQRGLDRAAEATVDEMLRLKMPIRDYAFVALINAYSNAGRHQAALGLRRRMRELGVPSSVYVLNMLLTVCVRGKHYEQGLELLAEYEVTKGPARSRATHELVATLCAQGVDQVERQRALASAIGAAAAAFGGAMIRSGMF
jgi:pentatricopeptide repeat protein